MSQLSKMFREDSDNFIDKEEFKDSNNLTEFIHCLANVIPTIMYNNLTGSDLNTLDFNHIANKLCFQFSEKRKKIG